MALRSNYSNLDMIRMAKFAKENPDLKPIPLIQAYNEKYPEVSDEQKMKNIVNWYQGVDEPTLWQRLYKWRISPKTAWTLANGIWLDGYSK